MSTGNAFILDDEDIQFCLYDWLDVESLIKLEKYQSHSRETFDGVLNLTRQLAEDYFLPHRRDNDLNEPHLVDGEVAIIEPVKKALEKFAEAGMIAATIDEDHGGFQLPQVIYRVADMYVQSANAPTSSYAMLTAGAAKLIREHASEDLIERYLPPMLEGRWFGTMNLSEPAIGSSLGDLTTSATRQEDGTYRLRGDKMWISGGDHELAENIVHLVLARTGGPGIKGLSLFIVPKWLGEPGNLTQRNDVQLVGLNHKMGWRGTTNTHLRYGGGAYPVGDTPGAVGYLIGEEGRGLKYMFLMMNEARLGVGASAVAMSNASFLHAREYARERLQGRPVDGKDPNAPQVPIIRHPDVRRMLMSAKAYAHGGNALIAYAGKNLDLAKASPDADERAQLELFADVLTPIVKSWPSQWGLEGNALAIQVLGGAGYTRDYPLEQFYRDNRLNMIHEGTHGIQALDLLGRKVLLDGGAGFRTLIERMDATLAAARAQYPELAAQLELRVRRLEETTSKAWESGDVATALGNATAYLEATGDVVIGWLLLDQAVALGERGDEFARGKRDVVRFFITHLLPRADERFALVADGDRLLVDLDDTVI